MSFLAYWDKNTIFQYKNKWPKVHKFVQSKIKNPKKFGTKKEHETEIQSVCNGNNDSNAII